MKSLFFFGVLFCAFAFVLSGAWHSAVHRASQSWDQENLKRNDLGCPTAIYVAPGGNLEQCR